MNVLSGPPTWLDVKQNPVNSKCATCCFKVKFTKIIFLKHECQLRTN